MPMLFINGGNDGAYYPDTHAKTYALVQSPKNLHFVPQLPHGHIFDRPAAIEVFIGAHLKHGTPLAKISSVEIEDEVVAKVESKTKLMSAQLHYTQDVLPGDSQTRSWTSKPAMLKKDRITAPLPPEDSSIWFLTVTDVRGTTVSSPLVIP